MVHLAFDTAAKFHRMAHFRAFVVRNGDDGPIAVTGVELNGATRFATSYSTVAPSGNNRDLRIEISAVGEDDYDFRSLVLSVNVRVNGTNETLTYEHAEIERRFLQRKYSVTKTWDALLADPAIRRIIDIGGRARSGVSRKNLYPGKEVVVADILSAPDVDLVVDVHEISRSTKDRFDAFMSIATFEHLLMPWKAAVEINAVLRSGGVGLVVTHQTLGIHEVPYDFYRYSDNAWKGIFNRQTGFEILDFGMTLPAFIIPTRWQKQFESAERAVGYMTSACVVRKIAEPDVDWPVEVSSITADRYPH
jgi:hypothetical protein